MAAYISFQPSDFFNTVLYTGTGATHSVTGVGFQPDFTWIKQRDGTYYHQLYDSVRGAGYHLASNDTAAQSALDTAGLSAWGADGFTVNTRAQSNYNTGTFSSWNWKANGAGSTNEDGNITSTVSANTTAGFSIVKYTGTGSAQTVGHGLGAAPNMIILKESTSTSEWQVSNDALGWTKRLNLNDNSSADTTSTIWNDTAPTSTVFSIGTSGAVSESGQTYIVYCFASKKGFSKFGSYTGNGNADGPFIYTGFRPAFVIIKKSSGAGSWWLFDNKRIGYNVNNYRLFPDATGAEDTTELLDLVSNGFKIRNTDGDINFSGSTLNYMAFAEFPFVSSNSKATVAR